MEIDESRKVSTAPSAASVGASGVVVTTDAAPAPSPVRTTRDTRVKKVIVAVHGVGDQYSFATLQSVVNQFCGFYRQPAATPLGRFHTGKTGFSIHPPYPRDPFERIAFAEVYWAKIPREIVDEKHTMEESKKWAATIVERLRMRWSETGHRGDCRDGDFNMMKLVLAEMIQTLAVLERLCYLADRAGLFTFDLRKLLEEYLGDVQVVAEFQSQREKILAAFRKVMTDVGEAYPEGDIFIIAHSEGTVVSLLGLLEAGIQDATPGWLERVRGFMTIGSPIDKHLILWPDLFCPDTPHWTPPANARIEWRNYYDRGDPIGASLNDARTWLVATGWDRVFNFAPEHDFGFDRYPLPGKAHVDYWTDSSVFGHFIETVVNEPVLADGAQSPVQPMPPPRDIKWKKWLSYVVPYFGVAAVLFLGVFILYKTLLHAIDPNGNLPHTPAVIFRGAAAMTTLLLGITIATRILRLAADQFWRVSAFFLWIVFIVAYLGILNSGPTANVLRNQTQSGVSVDLFFAIGLGFTVWFLAQVRPSWGLKPLILLGTALIAYVIGQNLQDARSGGGETGPIWPVFLATAAFLYLWWLSALIFDLVFVWHLHIRQEKALARLDEIIGTPWSGKGNAADVRAARGKKRHVKAAGKSAHSA